MSSSYQAAGWVEFSVFIVAGVGGALALRWNAKHQATRLKLLLYLMVVASSVPTLGFEALPGLGGNNVVAGKTVNWARYVLNTVRLSFFAAFAALCLDPNAGKAFVAFWIGVGLSVWTIFAAQSSNDGVWYWWIFSAITAVCIFAPFVTFFLQVPEDRLKHVSNTKHWIAKAVLVLGYWVYVFVGYPIDTPWNDATGGDLSLLQWLNVGWDIIFFIAFGLWMLGWVDLFEENMISGGLHLGAGAGGLPWMAPVHTNPCANELGAGQQQQQQQQQSAPNGYGYAAVPSTAASGAGLAMPR